MTGGAVPKVLNFELATLLAVTPRGLTFPTPKLGKLTLPSYALVT